MNSELKSLIDSASADGSISVSEKEYIYKKAEELGVPTIEVEIYIKAALTTNKMAVESHANIKNSKKVWGYWILGSSCFYILWMLLWLPKAGSLGAEVFLSSMVIETFLLFLGGYLISNRISIGAAFSILPILLITIITLFVFNCTGGKIKDGMFFFIFALGYISPVAIYAYEAKYGKVAYIRSWKNLTLIISSILCSVLTILILVEVVNIINLISPQTENGYLWSISRGIVQNYFVGFLLVGLIYKYGSPLLNKYESVILRYFEIVSSQVKAILPKTKN
jgi:hypothetical protein